MKRKKNDYGTRKFRKGRKMRNRRILAFWDRTEDPYKGKERDIMLTLCKSSSLETLGHAESKLKELEDGETKTSK